MAIMLIVIYGYFISGYWWLSIVIILMAIGDYSISGYWCLSVVIILMAISGYFIGGYFINGINGYCIISYCWLLYVILQLLMIIVL